MYTLYNVHITPFLRFPFCFIRLSLIIHVCPLFLCVFFFGSPLLFYHTFFPEDFCVMCTSFYSFSIWVRIIVITGLDCMLSRVLFFSLCYLSIVSGNATKRIVPLLDLDFSFWYVCVRGWVYWAHSFRSFSLGMCFICTHDYTYG